MINARLFFTARLHLLLKTVGLLMAASSLTLLASCAGGSGAYTDTAYDRSTKTDRSGYTMVQQPEYKRTSVTKNSQVRKTVRRNSDHSKPEIYDYPGETIIGGPHTVKKTSVAKTFLNPSGVPSGNLDKVHTVKAGETLWRIARSHGVTVDEIKRENQLAGDAIRVGETLRIPKS